MTLLLTNNKFIRTKTEILQGTTQNAKISDKYGRRLLIMTENAA